MICCPASPAGSLNSGKTDEGRPRETRKKRLISGAWWHWGKSRSYMEAVVKQNSCYKTRNQKLREIVA